MISRKMVPLYEIFGYDGYFPNVSVMESYVALKNKKIFPHARFVQPTIKFYLHTDNLLIFLVGGGVVLAPPPPPPAPPPPAPPPPAVVVTDVVMTTSSVTVTTTVEVITSTGEEGTTVGDGMRVVGEGIRVEGEGVLLVGVAGGGRPHLPSGGRRSSSCSADSGDERISHARDES